MIRIFFYTFILFLTSFSSFSQDSGWKVQYDSCKYYFNKGNYTSSAALLNKLIPSCEKNIQDTSVLYEMKYVLGLCYIRTGQSSESEKLFKQTYEYYSSHSSFKLHSNYFNSCLQLAIIYFGEKKYVEAEPLFKKALEIRRETKGEKNPDYITLLNNLAAIETSLKKYSVADSIHLKVISLKKETYGENHPEYVNSLNNLATIYRNSGRNRLAEDLYNRSKGIIKDSLGENHPDYIAVINNLGLIYKASYRYKDAELAFVTVTNFKKQYYGAKSKEYASTINNISSIYKIEGKYNEAEFLLKDAVAIYKTINDEKDIDYAQSLSLLAGLNRSMGHFSKSEELYLEAKEIYKSLGGKKHSDYPDFLNNLALLYDDMGRYQDALNLYKEVLDITKLTLGTTHPAYATSLNNLALLYKTVGRYELSEPLFKQTIQIRKEALGVKHIEYAESLNDLAILYQNMGRNKEAEPLYLQALEIIKNSLGDKHPEYASTLNNLAGLYESMELHSKAEPLYIESLEISKETLGENHPDYATALNNLALLYEKNRKYKEAEVLYLKDLEIIKNTLGINHPNYANGLSNLAGLYENMAKYNEAESMYLQSIKIRKDALGEKHPDYAIVVNALARIYTATGKLEEAEKLWKQAIDNYLYQIYTYFPSMSEKEKELFYTTIKIKFEQFNSFALKRSESNPMILSTMYDNQLATKALLLNTSNKLRERILTSNDQNLISAYKNWQIQKEYLAKVYTLSKAEIKTKNIRIDSLEEKINELEKELSLKSELFKSTTDKQNYKWQDVQKHLKPGEAAIEIIRFIKYKSDSSGIYTDSAYYAALIVKPETKAQPEIVLLKNGRELEKRFIKYYRNAIKFKVEDPHAYIQYWGKIKEHLNGITKVYFSPDGVYNQINLYSIKNLETNNFIIDEIEIETVTNTKDLLENPKTSSTQHKIVLVGNPSFYTDGNIPENTLLSPLPGTNVEVDRINQMMTVDHWTGNVYTGSGASEATIKGIKDPGVLHIATHGFFESDLEITEDNEDVKKQNPLLRSGLMLAGSGMHSHNNDEDGILTAYEAMNLSLDNTDLVVLSACETGLGVITNGEGVYGLQRAFRVAGTKSIIISLWKISDETTQQLMVSFYETWLKTGNKRDAFKEAQAKLRKNYPDPYYWGAFIMIGE